MEIGQVLLVALHLIYIILCHLGGAAHQAVLVQMMVRHTQVVVHSKEALVVVAVQLF
jgi:hypothetical protein